MGALSAKYFYFLYLPDHRDRAALSPFLLAKTGAAAGPELLVALAIFAALALAGLAVSHPLWRRLWQALALAIAVTMVAVNLAGAETVRIYGMDPKIGMVLYADFFSSENGRAMIASFLPAGLAIAAVASAVAALFVSAALAASARLRALFALIVPVAALALIPIIAVNLRIDAPYKHSPTVSIVRSLRTLDAAGIGQGTVAPLPMGEIEPAVAARPEGISNVIVVVLESAAAQYFGVYGAPYGATPVMDRLAERGLVGEAVYAHFPASTPALASILSSRYPPVQVQNWRPSGPMLPATLSRAGWDTGFFHSSDLRYDRADALIESSGFETTRDYRTRACARPEIWRHERHPEPGDTRRMHVRAIRTMDRSAGK